MSTLTDNPGQVVTTAAIQSALDHYDAAKTDQEYDAQGQSTSVGPSFNLAKGLAWVAAEINATIVLTWPTVPAPSDPARADWEQAIEDQLARAKDGFYLYGFLNAGRA